METYQDFLSRINEFEKKELRLGDAYFSVNPSLAKKVGPDNRFMPFYGDTVVFNLDVAAKERLTRIAQRLYASAPECFCEPLVPQTYHMTLHDLSSGPCPEDLGAAVFENEQKVTNIVKNIGPQIIRMKSKAIFNMVNTSLVMGLYPEDQEEYRKLMVLYHLFDDVRKLDYPLTPHITLAYYNRRGFTPTAAEKLEAVVGELNEEAWEIVLDTRELVYQQFAGMNNYVRNFPPAEEQIEN